MGMAVALRGIFDRGSRRVCDCDRNTGLSRNDESFEDAGREVAARDGERASCGPCTPLMCLDEGAEGVVASVRGAAEMRRHLETLGFVEGARIRMASVAAGSLVVEVKGARIALDQRAAAKVSVYR